MLKPPPEQLTAMNIDRMPPTQELLKIRQEPPDLGVMFYKGYDDLDSLLWGRPGGGEFPVTLVWHKGNASPGMIVAFDLGVSLYGCAELLPKFFTYLGLCNKDVIWVNPELMPKVFDAWEKIEKQAHPMRELLNVG